MRLPVVVASAFVCFPLAIVLILTAPWGRTAKGMSIGAVAVAVAVAVTALWFLPWLYVEPRPESGVT